jgi:hypothetical protein
VRGVAVDQNGSLQIYNGSFGGDLVTLNPASGAIQNHTFPGWSTINSVSFGGIATSGNYAFVTDMATFGHNGADLAEGLIRFNLTNFSAVRFTMRDGYQQLTLGRDGLLYALPGQSQPPDHIDVYDPATLAFVRSIPLSFAGFEADLLSIAVDASGHIFGVGLGSGDLLEFDSNGQLLKSERVSDTAIESVALDADGDLIASDEFGNVFIATTALDAYSSFNVCCSYEQVAFTDPNTALTFPGSPIPEPATVMLIVLASAVMCCIRRPARLRFEARPSGLTKAELPL